MKIQIFGKAKSFDTKKAERYFKERGIPFQSVDILRKGLSRGELDSVLRAVGGLEAVIDDTAKDYCMIKYLLEDANLYMAYITREAAEEKLLDNPQLFNTPIVRNGRQATVGYCPEIWKQWEEAERHAM